MVEQAGPRSHTNAWGSSFWAAPFEKELNSFEGRITGQSRELGD
jgi:hypothetical protein